MTRPHLACGVGLLVASLVVTTPRPAFGLTIAPKDDATSLIVQADAAHEAGRTTEAAELYVRAYRAMSPEERESLGEVVVGAALEELHASHRSTSDAAFAETAAELLEEYERDSGGAVPDDLAEHRTWIDEARAAAASAVDAAQDEPTTEDTTVQARPTSEDRHPGKREVVGPVLIGVGAAAAIGGAVLIALGAPLGKDAERSRTAALADPRFTGASPADQMAFSDAYDEYVSDERKRGRGFIGGGAALLVIGVGVATYGIVRLVQQRRTARGTARVTAPGTARVRVVPGGFAF